MAKKKGNGEGSITKHPKRDLYMARYTVDTATGPKRRTLYAKTRKEAWDRLTEVLASVQKGITADASTMTVGAFVERWLEDSVRGSVRTSTYDRNESLCRVQITLDTYSHVLPNMQHSAVAAMEEAFS